MRAVIISDYALIREGLFYILSKHNNIEIKLVTETFSKAMGDIKDSKIDIVFLDSYKSNEGELLKIKEMKENGLTSKFVILDFNSSKELFIKAIKCGVEGYVLGKSNEEEIMHVIDQICKGKKYFDAYFIDSMINENITEPEGIDNLTAREKEILCEIGKGMNNHKIAEKLYISENTVKKHINHIFEKLNIKDRTQAALYVNRCGLINKNAS